MGNPGAIQIEKWQSMLQASRADAAAWQRWRQVDELRAVVCKEMVALLQQYLNRQCDTRALRETFDRKTRNEWSPFGLKGMSGAMFLNMLVKHISDENSLSAQLREVLPSPKDTEDGRKRMQSFMGYLAGLIQSGKVSKGQVQPARVPFFVSAWWHVQDTERWPVFYVSGRRVLDRETDYCASENPVEDYFAFRERFLPLAAGLQIQSWDFEHLLSWHDKPPSGNGGGNGGGEAGGGAGANDGGETGGEKADPSTHVHMQWLLAKIGHKVGCRVWIAANDHNKEWNGQKLGDLSIKDLPVLGVDGESQKIIRMIDVVWIRGANEIVAAFEVEHTTSIFSGLLRMSDLVVSSPNLKFPLYLVAPEVRLPQVRAQLSRLTFQRLELHECCGFFSCEALVHAAEGIMGWANDPSVIDRLAARVEDARVVPLPETLDGNSR
ncbi:MAG: hypothetical protein ABSG86_10470 [Thermoguttaceae bacterium]|jgi:hypothetical protein